MSQEIEKNKNGPFNVIRLHYFKEKDYRALNALSYSRLSDIEKVGFEAVNAPVQDIGGLRGPRLGSIVDDVISNRLERIPAYVIKVKKMPNDGSSTLRIVEYIVNELDYLKFSDIKEEDLVMICLKNDLFTNGVTINNVYAKMKNYADFIEKKKTYRYNSVNFVGEYDYLITGKAIGRLRNNEIFSSNYANSFTSKLTKSHIEYQLMLLATINGIEFKCMLDAVFFNHEAKTIKPIDIKTGALAQNNFNEFIEDCYCFYNYYIQSGMYKTIVKEYFKYHSVYHDYEVLDFEFHYSTTSPAKALKIENTFVFTITKEMHLNSFKGFSTLSSIYGGKNKEFKTGIAELFNYYKKEVINPPTREDSLAYIRTVEEGNLPF